MTLVGISSATKGDGAVVSTVFCTEPFDPFFNDVAAGRTCSGVKAVSIYVGPYDCSNLQIGDEIEVYYDRAVTTAKGTFQSVKHIEIVNH